MKQHRMWRFLTLLLCVSLSSCGGEEPPTPGDVLIEGVIVSPESGSGAFSGTVKFSQHSKSDEIICDATNSGNDKSLVVFTTKTGPSDGRTSADFTFTPTEPGQYVLECSDSTGEENVNFTVISVLEPQAQSGNQPLGPEQFKTATLSYLSFINQTAPGVGGPPYWCFTGDSTGGSPMPPLIVAPDGSITGDCKGAFKSGSISVSYAGKTNGHWDTHTGKVTWAMDMSIQQESGPYSTTKIIKIHDSGPISTASDGVVSAEGMAEWTASCQSNDSRYECIKGATSYNWSGTLKWKMTFNQ